MIKTVVFGGTFDPVHIGHKTLLKNVMEQGYDRAIVIPDNIPPHKSRKTADFKTRLGAVQQMFLDMPNVVVSDIESKRDGKSYTVDTLELLKKEYPDSTLYLLMGSDMLLYIEKWYRFEDILKSTPIICAARTKADRQKIQEFKKYLENRYECTIIIYDFDVVDVSSTMLRDPLVKRITEHNKTHLKPSRLAHVNSVADYALTLAPLHNIDPFKAYVAALAHDCTKYMTDNENLEYFKENNIIITDDDFKSPKIYHQISGAHFAEHSLGIRDEDVLNAIRYHTTGREDMSDLEKLTCLADSIEPSRDYDGVEKMREVARYDLDSALLMSLDRLVEYVKARGLYMNSRTIKARDYLKGKNNG